MRIRTALAVLLLAFGMSGVALGQAGGDTRRKSIAITYPDKGRIRLLMQGTTAAPKANGAAEVRRNRGLSQIEIELDDMVPAYLLGADYTTYVMWAITPQGQAENLGEFRLNGSRSKLLATTKFQTFSLIVTAEPHFAVEQPSRRVVLENIPASGPGVTVQTSDVFFTGDSGRYYSNQDLPDVVQKTWAKQPLEVLGARRALEIATLANAERFAQKDYATAKDTLSRAEEAFNAGDRPTAEMLGRDAILQAKRAQDIAEERARVEDERKKQLAMNERIRSAEMTSQQYLDQIDDIQSRLKVETMGRERAEDEAARAHEELAALRVENRTLKAQIDQLTDQNSKMEERVAQVEKQQQADALASQRDQAYRSLTEMLRPLATVANDARGFKVVLPDSLFAPGKATLTATASAKLNPIAAVMLAQPSVQFVIEGYADDRSGADGGMQLSQDRAAAIAAFLTAASVDPSRFTVTGYGSASPVSTAKTLKGRALNRRVEIVFMRP